MSISADLPPALKTHYTDPPPEQVERRSWQWAIAPTYIGLFLWVVFLDPLAVRTLPVGGLAWSVAGAAIAGVLCYRLLYYVPAMWGMRTGYPLTILGTSTFGVQGSTWLTGLLMALAQVVWFAVANYFAAELILEGLVAGGLLDQRYLRSFIIGRLIFPGMPLLFVSLVWCLWTALTGLYLVRIIAALMTLCSIFPAAMLGWAVLSVMQGGASFQPSGVDPVSGEAAAFPGLRACGWMVQLIFGFFATAGAASANWGVALREERDVRLGGWVGVAFASWIMATLALLTVAGGLSRLGPSGSALVHLNPTQYLFHNVFLQNIGGKSGAIMLLFFGLTALAPATYAAWYFGSSFFALRPQLQRRRWTLLGALTAWLLILTGLPGRLETIFSVIGAAIAPMIGALAADYYRQGGKWPGPRRGVNPAGMVAWGVGLTVGLAPTIARSWNLSAGDRFQPAAVFAFLTAFLVYLLLARLGGESPRLTPAEPAEGGDSGG